jgi:hypothetical protein
MECWRNARSKKINQTVLFFPILQYSSTPVLHYSITPFSQWGLEDTQFHLLFQTVFQPLSAAEVLQEKD